MTSPSASASSFAALGFALGVSLGAGCLPPGMIGFDCATEVMALDADGDLYLPSTDAPDACGGDWETALDAVVDQGYADGDCDDSNADVHPGAEDLCDDALDQDCDGTARAPTTFYVDSDSDGFGATATASAACTAPQGTVELPGDCDDSNPDVNPGSVERACADGVDEDCDGNAECAVAGDLGPTRWLQRAAVMALGEGAGRSLDADERGEVLVGGTNGVWLFHSDERELVAEELTFDGPVDAGADVGLLDVDGDEIPEPVVGDPGFADASGRITLGASPPGVLTTNRSSLGTTFATAAGLLVTAVFDEDIEVWFAFFVLADDLPDSGSSSTVSDIDVVTPLSFYGTAAAPPALTIDASADGWWLALGEPENDVFGYRVEFFSILNDSISRLFYVRETDATTTLGTSVLLMDIDGDTNVDLLVGEPAAATIYVFAAALGLEDEQEKTDATWTITRADMPGFGQSMARVPDMDGDGVDDLLVGTYGGAALLRGSATGPSVYATLQGPVGFGDAVAGADVDQDGFGDLIIGDGAGHVSVLWGGPPA